MLRFLLLVICALRLALAQPAAVPQFNILDFGAVGNGKYVNTVAFKGAVQNASVAANSGLGRAEVVVPAGRFVTGGFLLSDGVYLRLLTLDSEIYASDQASDYSCVPSETTDTGPCDFPLVGAVGRQHTGILGPGRLNGGANDPPGHLVAYYNATLNMLVPATLPFKEDPYTRVKLVVFKLCQDVLIRDVQLVNSPLWTCTIVQCTDVMVDNVTVLGDRRWPNNDGFDPISSSNVTIQNSFISTGDDGVCISTHIDAPAERITVRNCTIASTSAALKLGGFCLGEYRDILFDNNRVIDSNRGLCLMPRWGSANITNVVFSNIEMETRYFSLGWWGTAEAISVTQLEYTGTTSAIRFVNITSHSEAGIWLYTDSGTLADVEFTNVSVQIDRWSNYSHPCLDFRPCSNRPEIVPALTDGFYTFGGSVSTIRHSLVAFTAPIQPYWGTCYNTSNGVRLQNNTCVN